MRTTGMGTRGTGTAPGTRVRHAKHVCMASAESSLSRTYTALLRGTASAAFHCARAGTAARLAMPQGMASAHGRGGVLCILAKAGSHVGGAAPTADTAAPPLTAGLLLPGHSLLCHHCALCTRSQGITLLRVQSDPCL